MKCEGFVLKETQLSFKACKIHLLYNVLLIYLDYQWYCTCTEKLLKVRNIYIKKQHNYDIKVIMFVRFVCKDLYLLSLLFSTYDVFHTQSIPKCWF